MMDIEHHHSNDTQVSLSEHFARIYQFLSLVDTFFDPDTHEERTSGYELIDLWAQVSEPLRLAASIAEIEVTPDLLFGNSVWNKDALEFEFRMGKLTSLYIRETTRFIWAWIAYDMLVKKVNGDSDERNSKTSDKIITFLKKDESLIPIGLAHNFQHTATLAMETGGMKQLNNYTKNNGNKLFPHIHFCRIARNCFLHSHQVNLLLNSDVREYSEEDFLSNGHIAFPRTLTRLVLLTIQHILAVYYKDSKYMTDLCLSTNEDEADLPLSDVLLVLHLEEVALQMRLPIPPRDN